MANKDLIIKHKRAKGDDGYRTFSRLPSKYYEISDVLNFEQTI